MQRCQNTVGSFECSCQPGFTLNVDEKSCDGKSHIYNFIQEIDVAIEVTASSIMFISHLITAVTELHLLEEKP